MSIKYLPIIVILFHSLSLPGQAVFEGVWATKINKQIDMMIEVTGDKEVCAAYLSVPLQGIDRNKSKACNIAQDTCFMQFPIPNTNQSALLSMFYQEGEMKGIWMQGGRAFALSFEPIETMPSMARPQQPKGPFDYGIQEVIFHNPVDSVALSGTFTYPEDVDLYPAVILISGSGPQNRNSTIFNHDLFWVLADFLSEQGIAVLRYDDRGVGRSRGNHQLATSETFKDDVRGAVHYLRNRNIKHVGLIGHSEGGMIAPMVANEELIDFIVSLAGPGIDITELMTIQNEIAIRESGFSKAAAKDYIQFIQETYRLIDVKTPKEALYAPVMEHIHAYYDACDSLTQQLLAPSKEAFYLQLAGAYFQDWFRYFINHKPSVFLEQIACPFLALNGTNDVQVTAKENLAAIDLHLSKSKSPSYEIHALENVNHLFQQSVTGNVSEYATIEESFNPQVLTLIADWILSINFE